MSELREKVREAYSAAASSPRAAHPFPVGRDFAERLGYPPEVLDSLPAVSVEAFTGVSDVSVFADLPEGATVLDLGCGAGLDSLVAARRVGPAGGVVGIDFSAAMLRRARDGAAQVALDNVLVCQAAAERLPLRDASVDVAIVNGVFNLNPERGAIFAELARVVRPGGAAFAAELVLSGPLPPGVRRSETDWFA